MRGQTVRPKVGHLGVRLCTVRDDEPSAHFRRFQLAGAHSFHNKSNIIAVRLGQVSIIRYYSYYRARVLQESFAPIPLCYSSNLKKLVNDLLQKDPLRRPDANELVEIVPDFVAFITESGCVEDGGGDAGDDYGSSADDSLNRWVVAGRIDLAVTVVKAIVFNASSLTRFCFASTPITIHLLHVV